MTLYFFNLYNDVTAMDYEGVEFPDLAAARAHGMEETRTMAAASAMCGEINMRHRIEIADSSGAVLDTICFSDAVTILS